MWNEHNQPALHGINDAAAEGLQMALSWIVDTSNLEIIKKEGQQREFKPVVSRKRKKKKKPRNIKIPQNQANKTTQRILCVADSCVTLRNLTRVTFLETESLLSLHPAAFHSTHQTSSRFMPCMEKLPSQELCPAFALLSLVTYLAVDWWHIWRLLVPHARIFSCLLRVCRCFSHLPGSLSCPPDDF